MTSGLVTGAVIHAAGYDRQSQERDNRSTASPAAQRAANKAEADRRRAAGEDVVWVGHFSEAPGTSAFGGKERPEFERLLNECRMGRVNMIIVNYVSRFSRLKVLDAIPIVTELLNLGVTVVSTTEGVFRHDQMMDLIHMIMRLDQAHNESKNKSTAVKGAHNLARSLGGYVGKVPYGFTLTAETVANPADGNRPVVIRTLTHNPDEVAVLRQVWATIQRHKDEPYRPEAKEHPGSLTAICRQLEADGIPTRGATTGKRTAGSAWDTATLKRQLRDPRIAGFRAEPVYAEGVTHKPAEYRIMRDPTTMRPLTLACGPIIPPAEWYELQAWLDGRGRGKGLSRGQALLSALDILYCECGAVMVGHAKAGNPDKSHYQCKRRRALPGQHAGVVTIQQNVLDDHVARGIAALVVNHGDEDPDTADIIAEATRRFGKLTETPQASQERSTLVAERADALAALEELYELQEAGGYRGPVGMKRFLTAEAAAQLRLEGAEKRIAELERGNTPELPFEVWFGQAGDDPLGESSWWSSASIEDKRALIKLFVSRVTVRKSVSRGRADPVEVRVSVKFASRSDEEDHEDAA